VNAAVVPVALGDRSYDVVIGPGLIGEAGRRIAPFAPGGRVAIVTDETVDRLHGAALRSAFEAAGLVYTQITLPPGEQTKSWAGLARVCEALLAWGIERRDLVVAFGGGVIGDLAGLAAGLVKRGVDFVQIPTTLLAQVDSSVGGKTAIDTDQGKNSVGLFHQPRLVLADVDALATLPVREVRAGYAEIVKYGLIDDPDFFDWCEANGAALVAGDPARLAYAVRHSAAAKARVVAADEREGGRRALLNLGHTFGHALEAAIGYDDALLHGEAVAVGCALAFNFSAAAGLAPRTDAARVEAHLRAVGFETDLTRLPGAPFDPDRLIDLMMLDKKTEGGALTLILASGIGRSFVQKSASRDAVRAFLLDGLARAA
jgi:3-dehydroquinate synthase